MTENPDALCRLGPLARRCRNRGRGITTLAVLLSVAVLLCAAAAQSDGIAKWRTPEGELYFGDHPPAGSVLVGSSSSLETIDPDSPTPKPIPTKPTKTTEQITRERELDAEFQRKWNGMNDALLGKPRAR